MKKLFLATSCLVLCSPAVKAADFPLQTKAAVVAAPAFSWTGCYVGAHVGGGTMTTNSEGSNGTGGLAGGQVGCNYQDGNWVFGLEGEGYWSGIRQTNASSEIPNVLNGFGFNDSFRRTTSNNNDFTIAARAGITFDRTLIYGKGGWAWGSFKSSSIDFCCGLVNIPSTNALSGTLDGFLVGAGVEHALTRNWTVKFEYNFIAFGSKELSNFSCQGVVCAVTGTSSLSATKQIFKVGANYLFDFGGAPVIAKY
jgi:outer membrane immunogenic protein